MCHFHVRQMTTTQTPTTTGPRTSRRLRLHTTNDYDYHHLLQLTSANYDTTTPTNHDISSKKRLPNFGVVSDANIPSHLVTTIPPNTVLTTSVTLSTCEPSDDEDTNDHHDIDEHDFREDPTRRTTLRHDTRPTTTYEDTDSIRHTTNV